MEDYQLLIDLHKGANRQGPGGDAETEKALDLAVLDREAPLKIADIGCGTGASTLVLARLLNAQVTAVDLFPDFLDVLEAKSENLGLSHKIKTLCGSMGNLPFKDAGYDAIWSEGAIYNIGFENGVTAWRRYLKPGGRLVVSEITWTTGSRPSELQKHWESEYPEIDVASSKFAVLEKNGFSPMGYFVLPSYCWLTNYYQPMQKRFADFLARNGNSDEARAIVDAEKHEIGLYKKYQAYYSYGVYVAVKRDPAEI